MPIFWHTCTKPVVSAGPNLLIKFKIFCMRTFEIGFEALAKMNLLSSTYHFLFQGWTKKSFTGMFTNFKKILVSE